LHWIRTRTAVQEPALPTEAETCTCSPAETVCFHWRVSVDLVQRRQRVDGTVDLQHAPQPLYQDLVREGRRRQAFRSRLIPSAEAAVIRIVYVLLMPS
jgi:hypothetical protein